MLGRTPGDLLAVRPLREGIISDCTIAEAMVRAFLHKAAPGRLLKPPSAGLRPLRHLRGSGTGGGGGPASRPAPGGST